MNKLSPGQTLLDMFMKPRQLSQNAVAKAIGVPPRRINEIILGKRAISADTAVRLGYYFGNSASYWMHLQAEYDIVKAKENIGHRLHMIKALHMDEKTLASGNNSPQTRSPVEHRKRANIKRRLMR